MVNVASSAITSVNYDPDSATLSVTFRDGSFYIYDDVPQSVYDELIGASSPGGYFNSQVRDEYSYRAV
jgi:hypothetical protein